MASRRAGGARPGGTEGDGLPGAILHRVDARASIPMSRDTDSLNVAAASAIALHTLRPAARRHSVGPTTSTAESGQESAAGGRR